MNKKRPMTPALAKLNKARDLIHEAKELIDEVLQAPEVEDFRFVQSYYVYGRYGIDQILGQENCHWQNDSIQTLIGYIETEGI